MKNHLISIIRGFVWDVEFVEFVWDIEFLVRLNGIRNKPLYSLTSVKTK